MSAASPAVMPATRMSERDIDRHARDIARQVAAGHISEQEGRGAIAALVHCSSRVEEVAALRATGQRARDLTESMRTSLTVRILDRDSDFFQIVRMRTASLSGWIRQTCYRLAQWDKTAQPSAMDASTDLARPVHDPGERLDDIELAYHRAVDQEGRDIVEHLAALRSRLTAERSAELLDKLVKGARPDSRAFMVALTIRHAHALPPVTRPVDVTDRQWVIEACRADQNAAARSVAVISSILCAGVTTRPDMDDRLLALWDEYSIDDLVRLAEHPPAVISTFVIGQVAPLPKPSRTITRALHAAVRSRLPGDVETRRLASELVGAYIARSCRTISEFNDTSDAITRAAMIRAAATHAAAWPDLAARASALPGHPLGWDELDIEVELTRLLVTLMSASKGC